jgi:hypothetical protein
MVLARTWAADGSSREVANSCNRLKTIAFTEEQVCGQKFLRDFAAACRKMSPLVEFTTRAFLLTLSPLQQVTLEPIAPQRPY